MAASTPLSLEAARAAHLAAIDTHTAAVAALRAAELAIADAADAVQLAHRELMRAEARADSDALPVGTVVRHRRWAELTGVIVPSDGSGLCVRQDASGEVTGGFTADEWIAVPS